MQHLVLLLISCTGTLLFTLQACSWANFVGSPGLCPLQAGFEFANLLGVPKSLLVIKPLSPSSGQKGTTPCSSAGQNGCSFSSTRAALRVLSLGVWLPLCPAFCSVSHPSVIGAFSSPHIHTLGLLFTPSFAEHEPRNGRFGSNFQTHHSETWVRRESAPPCCRRLAARSPIRPTGGTAAKLAIYTPHTAPPTLHIVELDLFSSPWPPGLFRGGSAP